MKQFMVAAAALWVCHAGVASAEAPAWCKGATFGEIRDLKELSSPDVEKVVIAFARATCKPSAEASARAADIDKTRQAWGKKLGMVESDWADAVAYANDDGRVADIKVSTNDLTKATPLDQYILIRAGAELIRPRLIGSRFTDPAYLADAMEPNLTEVGRLGYIRECIDGKGPKAAVNFAICQADIDALDVTKFATQLRGDTAHEPGQRMRLRLALYDLKATELKQHEKDVADIFKVDEAYKKLWDAAKEGRAEWASMFGKDVANMAVMQKLESGFFYQSRKMFEGCEATTSAALDAAITKYAPMDKLKNIYDVRDDPYGGAAGKIGTALATVPQIAWAAMPFILCQPDTQKAAFFSSYFAETPGYRGPRSTAYVKIMGASIVLDDMTAKVEYPNYSRPYAGGQSKGSAGGVVKSVKVVGDSLEVELEAMMVKREQCVSSHQTKRIQQITSSGSVIYESQCDKMGVVTSNDQWAPFSMAKEYQPVLKKGVRISTVYGQKNGALIATWANKTATVPNSIWGAPVK